MKKCINIFNDKYQYLHDSLLALLSHLRHTMSNPIIIPSITPTSSFSLQSVDEDDELELGDRNSGLITAYYEDINTSNTKMSKAMVKAHHIKHRANKNQSGPFSNNHVGNHRNHKNSKHIGGRKHIRGERSSRHRHNITTNKPLNNSTSGEILSPTIDSNNSNMQMEISYSNISKNALAQRYESKMQKRDDMVESQTIDKLNNTTSQLQQYNATERMHLNSKIKMMLRKHRQNKDTGENDEHEPLTLSEIEQMVPPSILVVFLSSYFVQVPTTIQVIGAYSERLWGHKKKVNTTRILCSLSVRFSTVAAKRAGVIWAINQIGTMDNITNTHKKRLIKSWNKAIAIADQAQLAEDRKMEKIYREELERKKELQIKLKEVFVQGRENEEKRLKTLETYLVKYPTINLSRNKTVNTIIQEGDRKEAEAEKRKQQLRAKMLMIKMFGRDPSKDKANKQLDDQDSNVLQKLRKSILSRKVLANLSRGGRLGGRTKTSMGIENDNTQDNDDDDPGSASAAAAFGLFGIVSKNMKKTKSNKQNVASMFGFGASTSTKNGFLAANTIIHRDDHGSNNANNNESPSSVFTTPTKQKTNLKGLFGRIKNRTNNETKQETKTNVLLTPSPPTSPNDKANTFPPRSNRVGLSLKNSLSKSKNVQKNIGKKVENNRLTSP